MKTKIIIPLVVLILVTACSLFATDGPPANAEIITVTASPNLASWLNEVVTDFNRQKIKTNAGKPVYAQVDYLETGQVVLNINGEEIGPDVWIPDMAAWAGLVEGYSDDCVSVVESPLLIAMWKPIAESLGWPGRDLGWLDIGSLAADPSAWKFYSGGQFGDALHLGHTHPGLSAAGANTMLAVVHAAQSKQEAVTVEDIEEPIVQASVGAFESSVTAFSPTTTKLQQSMGERGPSFLGAAVLYENQIYELVLQQPEIVPIYPLEGTFVSDFPACIRNSPETHQEAASIFRNYLLTEEAQTKALEYGLRSVIPSVQTVFEEVSFFDPTSPEIVYEKPGPEVLLAIQNLWEESKKPVNLVMVLDTSGSMEGEKLENAKAAAIDFIKTMNEDDQITIIIYPIEPSLYVLFKNVNVGESRDEIIAEISRLTSYSGTPLYDSLGLASEIIEEISSESRNNVILVLSDGDDTASEIYRYNANLIAAISRNRTNVYTIAYGENANKEVLMYIATNTNGQYYEGDTTSIAAIYEEMAILFGGSVGIGR